MLKLFDLQAESRSVIHQQLFRMQNYAKQKVIDTPFPE